MRVTQSVAGPGASAYSSNLEFQINNSVTRSLPNTKLKAVQACHRTRHNAQFLLTYGSLQLIFQDSFDPQTLDNFAVRSETHISAQVCILETPANRGA